MTVLGIIYISMKILVFTEGTILMHKGAEGLSRQEIVEQSRGYGIQTDKLMPEWQNKSCRMF